MEIHSVLKQEQHNNVSNENLHRSNLLCLLSSKLLTVP